jgi:hypothetical protein
VQRPAARRSRIGPSRAGPARRWALRNRLAQYRPTDCAATPRTARPRLNSMDEALQHLGAIHRRYDSQLRRLKAEMAELVASRSAHSPRCPGEERALPERIDQLEQLLTYRRLDASCRRPGGAPTGRNYGESSLRQARSQKVRNGTYDYERNRGRYSPSRSDRRQLERNAPRHLVNVLCIKGQEAPGAGPASRWQRL